jgi:hypothetical protein
VAPLNLHSAPRTDVIELDTDIPAAPAEGTSRGRHRRLSAPPSRVAYALGLATVCALVVGNAVADGPAAIAGTPEPAASVAVADALGIDGSGVDQAVLEDPELLGQLAASRSTREAEQVAAASSQAQAEQAAAAARAEAEAKAAADAAAAAAAAAAAEAARVAAAAQAAAPVRAAVAAAAGTTATAAAKINNSAGGVRPPAQAAANSVVSNVPGTAGITIGGTRASAADPGGHPSGLALDYMVGSNGGLGDAIVAYHLAHWDELGVEYIIWKQRMLSSPGGAWKAMSNRGSATANHMDHPHVNYRG